MAYEQVNEALEKLNQGKTKQMFQPQTIALAQEYSGKAIEMYKQQFKARRSALEDL